MKTLTEHCLASLDALLETPETKVKAVEHTKILADAVDQHAHAKELYARRMREFPNDFARAYAAYMQDMTQ